MKSSLGFYSDICIAMETILLVLPIASAHCGLVAIDFSMSTLSMTHNRLSVKLTI